MKKNIILLILSIFTLVSSAQTKINENPRIGFSAGLGVHSISNNQLVEPFSPTQLALQLNSKIKFQIKRNQENKRSWFYYSNSIMWMRQPNSPIAGLVNTGLNPVQDNLIHEQRIGFILRRWFLIEGGSLKELGTRKITGITGGCGILFPLKKSSFEIKGTYYFLPNFEQPYFVPGLVFHFDPKQ